MSALKARVDEYLRLRRALGFKLKEEGRLLGQLAAYLDAAGAETISTELAVRWAGLPVAVHPNHWSKRLGSCAGSPRICRRSTRGPRSRRPTSFPTVASAPPRTCSPSTTFVV